MLYLQHILALKSDIKYNEVVGSGGIFMAKMGRPPAENPKMYKVTVRMSAPDYEKLKKYNEATDQTITETMLEGFELLMKKKNKKA